MIKKWLSSFVRQGSVQYEKKIDLSQERSGFFGQHRSGWPYVLKLLSQLHTPNGILADTFIERTFCWHPGGVRPHKQPWIGFIHVPPGVPEWFQSEQSNAHIFRTPAWQDSLPYLKGLYALSEYHAKHLRHFFNIPIESLVLPTKTPKLKWTMDRFLANPDKKLIQVGWWLRRLHTIYLLPTKRYRKIFLRISHADIDSLLRKEREFLLNEVILPNDIYDRAESVSFQSNRAYDRLLSENLVIINLYDSSANNTVIECIARNTPLLVNPLESVKEYLGEEYPLYFNSLEEAAEKAENMDLIQTASTYLEELPIKRKLCGDYFIQSLADTRIYNTL